MFDKVPWWLWLLWAAFSAGMVIMMGGMSWQGWISAGGLGVLIGLTTAYMEDDD